MSPRRVGALTAALGAVLLVALAWWRVPWDPAGPLPTPDPARFFDAAVLRRGEDFARWARVWSLASTLVSLAVAVAVAASGVGRRVVERWRGPWWWRSVLAVVVLVLLGRVVTLPFAVLLRARQRAYGLSEQPWPSFALDLVRTEAVQVVTTSLGALVLLAVARRWRRAWPAVAGVLVAALVVVGSFVYPLLVEPVFNRFTPLPDGPLRSGVLALADREGVRVDDVLVADASRRTTTINAYVSGFGGTRRVVLYDTLVADLPQDEALAVVAHVLAHARHVDVLTGTALGAAGALVGLGLLAVVLGGRRRGAEHRDAPLGAGDVPLLLAVLAAASLLVLPVQNAVSRELEARADVDALAATGDPAAFVGLQQQLAQRSAADLDPPAAWQWWFGSHPTTMQRIALALRVQDEGDGG